MPHKGNGAMFIQYFICQGDERTHSQSKVLRSRAIGGRETHENLKDLQVRLKVPNRHLVQTAISSKISSRGSPTSGSSSIQFCSNSLLIPAFWPRR